MSGSKLEYICDLVNISINKNSVFGDKSAINPGGVRIGTCALTTRGLTESDFLYVGTLIHECVILSLKIQEKSGKKLADFKDTISSHFEKEISEIRGRVNNFAQNFDFYESDNLWIQFMNTINQISKSNILVGSLIYFCILLL